MARFRFMRDRVTRSVVFERDVLNVLEEYAAAREQSLSSVVRQAAARFIAEEVGDPKEKDGERQQPIK